MANYVVLTIAARNKVVVFMEANIENQTQSNAVQDEKGMDHANDHSSVTDSTIYH